MQRDELSVGSMCVFMFACVDTGGSGTIRASPQHAISFHMCLDGGLLIACVFSAAL